MPFDEQALAQRYDILRFNVASSTQINTRASAIVESLSVVPAEGCKPTIVLLAAHAKAASKLISIVEIAKRDLTGRGLKCYQYTALTSRMTEMPRNPKRKARASVVDGQADAGVEAEGESDDVFETMAESNDGGMKKRIVPVMTVYLASSPVKELRTEYGEQYPQT